MPASLFFLTPACEQCPGSIDAHAPGMTPQQINCPIVRIGSPNDARNGCTAD
jgi:hypothetical protein